MAIGILGLAILLAAGVMRAQDGNPPELGPMPPDQEWSGEHRFDGGGPGEMGRPGEGHEGMPPGGPHEFGGGGPFLRLAENPRLRKELALTDEQVERLHKIRVEEEKNSIQTRADLELRHIELRELLRADNPDHDAIMQKVDQVIALEGKMQKQRVETLLSARGVLTPDQIKKLKALGEERGPERGRMMGRPGGMGRHDGPATGSAPESPGAPAQ